MKIVRMTYKLLILVTALLLLSGCKTADQRPTLQWSQDFTVKSYPAGAKVYYTTANGIIKSEVFKDCYTPCTMRFWKNAFQGRSTSQTHIGVAWSNGDFQWATVTLKKGVSSYYAFTNTALANAQKAQSDKANADANQLLFKILGAYVSAKTGSSQSSSTGYSSSSSKSDVKEDSGWRNVNINGKDVWCDQHGGDYDCGKMDIKDWSHGKKDGWHDVQINGKNQYCYKNGGTLDCR